MKAEQTSWSMSTSTLRMRWNARKPKTPVDAGTILHKRRTPRSVLVLGDVLDGTDKRGVSALLLQRQLGPGNYETAWMMLRKFRRAMVNATVNHFEAMVQTDSLPTSLGEASVWPIQS